MDTSNNQYNKSAKKAFSNKNEHNFQTANMENKLKNIKKRKVKNNFKNIETFNILKNEEYEIVNTDEVIKKRGNVDNLESFNTMSSIFTNNIIEGNEGMEEEKESENKEEDKEEEDKEEDSENKGKIASIFNMGSTPVKTHAEQVKEQCEETGECGDYCEENPGECEGQDEVEDPDKVDLDWREEMVKNIENSYGKFVDANKQFGEGIADVLSNGNATDEDKKLIREYTSTLFSAILAVPVSFNWYYVMFYALDNTDIEVAHLDINRLKEIGEDYGLMKLFLWFFEFALFFPSILDNLLTIQIPKYSSLLFNGKILYIFVYLASFHFIKNLAPLFKNFLVAIIKDATGSTLINLMTGIVLILFLVYVCENITDALSIIGLVLLFVRFITIILISVPVAAFFIFIYLIFNSFFAISWYSPDGMIATILNIIVHSDNAFATEFEKSCDGDSMFKKIMQIIFKLIGLLKSNIYLVLLLGIAFYYLIKMMTELSSTSGIIPGFSLKDSFMFFNLLLIVVFATWLYNALYDKIQLLLMKNN